MSCAKILGATSRQDGYLEGNGYLVSWCVGHLVELASEDIEKAATEAGISARTVRAAKRNLDGRITSKRIGAAWYHTLKK